MPSFIKTLPEHLANKIAAGEVVQRPASVIKELLENAIDAHAKSLTVIVKDAGRSLIHIVDDGDGMGAEDAKVAFARHSTSKIASYEDLENIRTFGFRGEALASIAAVSQVELKTRREENLIGTKVNIQGSKILEVSEDASPVGTSIQVKNLFYNTPGRRNFLKSNSTEFHHCLNVVHRTALAYPEIAITFLSDGEKIFSLPPGTLQGRIGELFGEKVSQSVFSLQEENPYVTIHGFLGKPDYSRKTRVEQYIFLNRRYIINRSISHAVLKGYEHLLEKGSFPFFILFLDLDPHSVDVNVHPSKMEVKFEDESAIYRHVFHTIRRALSEHDLLPAMGMKDESVHSDVAKFTSAGPVRDSMNRVVDWRDLLGAGSAGGEGQFPASFRPTQPGPSQSVEKSESESIVIPNDLNRTSPPVQGKDSYRSGPKIMQLHSKYIVIPIDSGVLLVDQHAAHERVLYEKTVERFGKHLASVQQLLFPIVNEMSAGDVELVRGILLLLEDLGFTLKIFGKTTIILEGVPVDVRPGYEKTILQDILDLYKEDEHNIELEPREKLAKSYSCRTAVKAGDPLNQVEMESLLDQLFATKVPYVCPHGRPVSIKISISELDKRFGRTS
jgi:DNA mismatch repair protein MutL